MPWSPTCCFQDVRVCLAQCLNQSFARAPANRRAGRAIDALSTRALPKPPRSITKLNAVIEVSPWHRVDRRAADMRLTSQWNGRLRAAHSGAVHRRVRCQIEISEFRHSNGMRERESTFSISGQSHERPFQCAPLLVSLVGPLPRWRSSVCVLYTQEELAQGADAVQRGAAPPRLDDLAPA